MNKEIHFLLPPDSGECSLEEMEQYVRAFYGKERLAEASEEELALCRKYTEILCEEENETALRLKGYACYGGNRLYPCDWEASKDCLSRLFVLTDDPGIANSMGYIFYYGRCNNGEPEYGKAFAAFTMAAANGYIEATYKLADMYLHGYGCTASPRTAVTLYRRAYEECKEDFPEHQDNNLADTALRMGNVYRQGIGMEKDLTMAYALYLQAEKAITLRRKLQQNFGDDVVALNISTALTQIRQELPEDFFCDAAAYELPYFCFILAENAPRLGVSFTETEEGGILTVRRLTLRKKALPALLTDPELDFCELTTKISYHLFKPKTNLGEDELRCDELYWDENRKRLECWSGEKMLGWVKAKAYILLKKKKKPTGRLLTMASVTFQPGGKIYDYLCPLSGIREGDRVVVQGYDGEAEATVVSLRQLRESELPLPLERYKSILRKV